mgnify:FL=1
MANMETFYVGLMHSQEVRADLRSIKYQVAGVDADVKDGALVTLGELAKNVAYGANAKDYNTYVATAPAADTDEIVIVDLSEVSQGTIAGNNYKIGIKQVGLVTLAGYPARVRIPHKHDMCWFSGDCFNADPTEGQYAIATAGSTLMTPQATVATGKFCVKIQAVKDFTVGNAIAGQGRTGKLYLCEVM